MLTNLILKYRRIVIVCVHLFLIVLSNLFAFLLRFEWTIPSAYYYMIGVTMPVIVLVRLGTRILREQTRLALHEKKGVFIYGAGDAGELLLRDMLKNPGYTYHASGFIDDDKKKKGLKIHSVPVLGSAEDLTHLINKHNPEGIIIAIPSAKPAQIQKIMGECKKHNVILKTLPSLRDVIKGQVTVNQIRDISIEDLLFRDPVTINPENIRDLVCGKRVLITGAAGSIGSELCRQIIRHNPRSLILYDRNENGLYFLDQELGEKYSRDFFSVVIYPAGSILFVSGLLAASFPSQSFLDSTYKHVPLM